MSCRSSRFGDVSLRYRDLVLTGAADNTWSNTGVEIDSEVQVLQTPAMVGLDWQRTVVDPRVLPCIRSGFADQIPKDQGALVSLKRISFPKVGAHAAAFRALIDVKASGGSVRMVSHIVLTYSGRTEISLTVIAPAATAAVLRPLELKLARLMVARAAA